VDYEQAWTALHDAIGLIREKIDGRLQKEHGLPYSYYHLLATLAEAPAQTLRMHELAEANASSRSRISHAVRRLEEQGFIHRTGCDSDNRGVSARLTERGCQRFRAATSTYLAALEQHLLALLPTTELSQLSAICDSLRARSAAGHNCP
jgi:DNA-binding MarR family transcriptional regulator